MLAYYICNFLNKKTAPVLPTPGLLDIPGYNPQYNTSQILYFISRSFTTTGHFYAQNSKEV